MPKAARQRSVLKTIRTYAHHHALVPILAMLTLAEVTASDDILQIKDDYFWSPANKNYFIPRGIAYQVWNPPVDANQSLEQVAYDLAEIKKLHANSIRAEFVWGEVEPEDDVFDWRKPDFLISQAEKLGLKLFIIIGFQYPPAWFNPEWYAIDDQDGDSAVLNYSHPDAHAVYQDYIRHVCERYRDSSAVGAWILGNEYAFFDLWEDPVKYAVHRFLGYDPISETRFQEHLDQVYQGDITQLNQNWKTAYSKFSDVVMPRGFPHDRAHHGFHDLIQWRKNTIGDFVAVGAKAAKEVDPNHLITYSMVGGIFNANDANNTAEDAKAIVDRCKAAGAPLDFWSINNYAWAEVGQELRSGDFGIAKYQAQAGLPVMISETGHSSTENLFGGAAERQPRALPGQVWESLLSGAIGTHIFTWNDRPFFTEDFFLRERGFGIVTPERLPKPNGVFERVREMFFRMDALNIDRLLGGSTHPSPDMQFFWSINADMGWPQANVENALLWGALKRLGYQPGLMDDAQYHAGAITNAPAVVLSRAFRMDPTQLDQIAEDVVNRGIHLHATFDLPGQYDTYHHPNPNWENQMDHLFGLDVSKASPGWASGATNLFHRTIQFRGNRLFGGFSGRYRDDIRSLKIWHGIEATSGVTLVSHTGFLGAQAPIPALHVKDHVTAKTAINTFALGDVLSSLQKSRIQRWDFHTRWLTTIYEDYFGITPRIDLQGPNSDYVFSDFRICQNGSLLISLLNGHVEKATVTLSAPDLIAGLKVENLTQGGVLAEKSSGQFNLALTPDDFVLLYAYQSDGQHDESLVTPHPSKIRFRHTPDRVWPATDPYPISVEIDPVLNDSQLAIQLEYVSPESTSVIASIPPLPIHEPIVHTSIQVDAPFRFHPDDYHPSSLDGAQFQWRAKVTTQGRLVTETTVPVQFNWPIKPIEISPLVEGRNQVDLEIGWEQLPSYSHARSDVPIDRAAVWDSLSSLKEQYEIRVELRSDDTVVATQSLNTRQASGSQQLAVSLPNLTASSADSLRWTASVSPVWQSVSVDVFDGFEGRSKGEDSPPPLFAPWVAHVHRDTTRTDEGIARDSDTSEIAAWVAMTAARTPDNSPQLHFQQNLQESWKLPAPEELPDGAVIQFDIKELSGRRLRVGAVIEDLEGHQSKLETPYRPGEDGWHRDVTVRLAALTPGPDGAVPVGNQVSRIAVTAGLIETGATYEVLIDNIRFTPLDIEEDFNDLDPMKNSEREFPPARISPWWSYNNSQFGNTRWLNEGVGALAAEGSQSAFLVVENPPEPGNFAVMGLVKEFDEPWQLPANPTDWSEFTFSCLFREENTLSCNVELQLKNPNGPNGELSLIRKLFAYDPAPDSKGWQRFTASLDAFEIPDYAVGFDPNHITDLIINIQLLEKDSVYVGMFDGIVFDGPDQILEVGPAFSTTPTAQPILPQLVIQRTPEGAVRIDWQGPGTLQSTADLNEPWSDLPNATPPIEIPIAGPQQFFRLR